MEFISLIFMAIIVEGLITYVKELIVDGKLQWQMLVSLAVGMLCAVMYGVDLFEMLGMHPLIPYVGCVLTGILISRGSNYIFDLIKKLRSVKSGEENLKLTI